MNDDIVIAKLKAQVKISGNQKRAAQALAISPQYLTDLLKGRRAAGESLLQRLGLQRKVVRS